MPSANAISIRPDGWAVGLGQQLRNHHRRFEGSFLAHVLRRVLQGMLRELYAENDQLRLMIQRLTRHQVGRRSEQLTVEQLQFGLEDREQTVAEHQAAQDAAEPADGCKQSPRADRRPARNHGALPSHLPRYEVVIDARAGSLPLLAA